MKKILTTFLLAFSVSIYAVGPTTIHGVNDSGERIAVDEEWLPQPENPGGGMRLTGFYVVSIKKNKKAVQEFGGQSCSFGNNTFSCTSEGESPLVGTTYLFVKDLPNCRGSLFVCKAGCGSRAPQAMIQDYWECPTLGANYYDACDPNNHEEYGVLASDNVNLRGKPDLTASVVGRLNKVTIVNILERQQDCLTINHEAGQWIKVQVDQGGSTKSGWIFDAYVEYTDKEL